MSTPDGRYWIVFNGEIYNYRELRQELERTGETFASQTDTEVILRLYARDGAGCIDRLRGMFVFSIWDNQRQQLVLARDPFGMKPIYYHAAKNTLAFASEVRALLASGVVPRRLSLDGLVSYLQFGSVQDPLTIVDGVHSLLPGHYLLVDRNEDALQVEEVACGNHLLAGAPVPQIADRREAVAALRKILEESLRLHLVSDVPLGAFLSGGIDSSALVALMSRVAGEKPKTFSVVFTETGFSEASHARLVAKTFGTEHREILLSEESLIGLLPSALEAMDQPTMDGVNTYVISKAVKEAGITVALSGLGGDELFAGYPSFRRAGQLRRIAILPQQLRRAASVLGRALSNGWVRHRKFWDLVESDCSPYAVYAISRELFAPAEIRALLRQTSLRSAPYSCNGMTDIINSVSTHELKGYMANTLLRDTDQMSMAHALEVRVPFLDPRVAQYVLGLPGEWKVDGRRPKPLLLDALGDLLPEEVWRRPKMGFTLPFERWMRSGLEAELEGVLLGKGDLTRLGMNSDYVKVVWDSFKRNARQEPWSRTWALYVLNRWCSSNSLGL
ncbi:MAG: asparagine synthase (glutamine-hydrolyzing) [Acidobacteria bacterium]|nr:MAG: asparagine synthase (glutamine-hydrolyzing) [Acidobacteriota bacterium]